MAIRQRNWRSGGKARSAWVVDYADPQGKRRLKTFKNKAAAESWWATASGVMAQGSQPAADGGITVAAAGEAWAARAERAGRERSTLEQYRQHLRDHINPLIGEVALAELTAPMVAQAKEDLLARLSRPTARKVLTSLKSLLKAAQGNGQLAQSPAAGVTIPGPQRPRAGLEVGLSIPSIEEIQSILGALEGRWRPLIVTAIFTGLRASELRGLAWDQVAFDKRLIRVRQRADKWNQLASPKSKAGQRDLPMTATVSNTLRAWRLVCPQGPLNLVFPNGAGNVEGLANIYQRGFAPAQIAVGLVDIDGRAKYGIQALRHFYAAWIIGQGFPPKRTQQLMGHATIQMTFDLYGQLFPSEEDDHARLEVGELQIVR